MQLEGKPMKSLLISICCLLASGSFSFCTHATTEVDLLIENGQVVDGGGVQRYRADVAVRGGQIVAIG